MGSFLIKPDPARDLYMEWSSNVDAPTFIGTRKQIRKYLSHQYRTKQARKEWRRNVVDPRLKRADKTGSSGYPPFDYGAWDEDGLAYKNRGVLPRRRLATYAEMLLLDPAAEADRLLIPFEDDEDDDHSMESSHP